MGFDLLATEIDRRPRTNESPVESLELFMTQLSKTRIWKRKLFCAAEYLNVK
jgi:hypothetical protein